MFVGLKVLQAGQSLPDWQLFHDAVLSMNCTAAGVAAECIAGKKLSFCPGGALKPTKASMWEQHSTADAAAIWVTNFLADQCCLAAAAAAAGGCRASAGWLSAGGAPSRHWQ
jgi:hypothetical protein